jgi:hypothetical protein
MYISLTEVEMPFEMPHEYFMGWTGEFDILHTSNYKYKNAVKIVSIPFCVNESNLKFMKVNCMQKHLSLKKHLGDQNFLGNNCPEDKTISFKLTFFSFFFNFFFFKFFIIHKVYYKIMTSII